MKRDAYVYTHFNILIFFDLIFVGSSVLFLCLDLFLFYSQSNDYVVAHIFSFFLFGFVFGSCVCVNHRAKYGSMSVCRLFRVVIGITSCILG